MGEAVLSIGTTHPWNAAGVGLDLRVAGELGVRTFTVVAAVSAQDASGVRALQAQPTALLREQLASIPRDELGAVRVGALPDAEAVEAVADVVSALAVPAVVDPVLVATRGGALGAADVLPAIRDRLGCLPNVILTPNLDEAALLLGLARIAREEIESAAAALRARGARAVLLKGGHLEGEPVDVLATADGVTRFSSPRLSVSMRGTGCVLAASLACALARGDALDAAVAFARGFVKEKIARARECGGLRVAY